MFMGKLKHKMRLTCLHIYLGYATSLCLVMKYFDWFTTITNLTNGFHLKVKKLDKLCGNKCYTASIKNFRFHSE